MSFNRLFGAVVGLLVLSGPAFGQPSRPSTRPVREQVVAFVSDRRTPYLPKGWAAPQAEIADAAIEVLGDGRFLVEVGRSEFALPLERVEWLLYQLVADGPQRERVGRSLMPLLDTPGRPDREVSRLITVLVRCGGEPAVDVLEQVVEGKRKYPVGSLMPFVIGLGRDDRLTADQRARTFDLLLRCREKLARDDYYYQALGWVDARRLIALMDAEDWLAPTNPGCAPAAWAAERLRLPVDPAKLAARLDALRPPPGHRAERQALLVLLVWRDPPTAEKWARAQLVSLAADGKLADADRDELTSAVHGARLEAHGLTANFYPFMTTRYRAFPPPDAIRTSARVTAILEGVTGSDLGRYYFDRGAAELPADVAALRKIKADRAADVLQAAHDAVGPGGRANNGLDRVAAVRALGKAEVLRHTDAIRGTSAEVTALRVQHLIDHGEAIRAWVKSCDALTPAAEKERYPLPAEPATRAAGRS